MTGGGAGKSADPAAGSSEPYDWQSLLGDTLLRSGAATSSVSTAEALSGKHVGIYFSAHWCPPCRAFTPQLVGTYSKLIKDGTDFEIVFVSMDRSQQDFDVRAVLLSHPAPPFPTDRQTPHVITLPARHPLRHLATVVLITAAPDHCLGFVKPPARCNSCSCCCPPC
jgi:thiol-disulfide isomerase/thioredoxin